MSFALAVEAPHLAFGVTSSRDRRLQSAGRSVAKGLRMLAVFLAAPHARTRPTQERPRPVTAGQSDRQASLDAVCSCSMLTGILLRRSERRTSARIGHQS